MSDNLKNNRRHLTPTGGIDARDGKPEDVHHMRRESARREVSERVYLQGADGQVREGWALNASRGGVRVILEETIELGSEHEVILGDADAGTQARGRIVWVQEEPDGVVAGIEYVNASGTLKSAPPPPPDDED